MDSLVKEIRKECGLPDEDKRSSLKKNLLKAGAIGVGVVALSGAGNAASVFWRDEGGNLTDLKNQSTTQTGVINFDIGDGVDLITVNTKGYLRIPNNCTITGWQVYEASETPITGSIVIDVWKDTTGNYPPTVADTIAGSEKPTLASATNAEDTSLNTWTTTILAGDFIGFNVDSNSGCKKVLLQIMVIK